MTDVQLAILLQRYKCEVERAINEAESNLPDSVKRLRDKGMVFESFCCPALDIIRHAADNMERDAKCLLSG